MLDGLRRWLQPLALGLLGAGACSPAAAEAGTPSVNAGLYLPYGIQPGVKLGARLAPGGLSDKGLFVAPQLSAFTRPGNHVSASFGVEFGAQRQASSRGRAPYASLGLAYLGAAQINTFAIDLSSGDATPERELRHYALPTLNLGLEQSLTDTLGLYGQLAGGFKLSPSLERSLFVAGELGLRFGKTGGTP